MERRHFISAAAAVPLVAACRAEKAAASNALDRVRPGDAEWPSEAAWNELRASVGGRLTKLESPLARCRSAPDGSDCAAFFRSLRNPYAIGDDPALTQTSGWVDAWTSVPSAYVVAAAETGDVVAAVNFARTHRLRLVVKGGGHSYQGTSCSADSLLVWTRAMNSIDLHDAFVPRGCEGRINPGPAVSIGAGAMWGQAYRAVSVVGGRYVQGGGCTTVGVAGLIQSGGFGSFSKGYGLAAAALLEAEVVTAEGTVRVVNACNDPELFWALKGGGGGSFGVVTRLTLRTRELPEFFGGVFGTITARTDAAYRRLVAYTLAFCRDRLMNPHWGEQLKFEPDRTVEVTMVFQGLTREAAAEVWHPFRTWVASAPEDYQMEEPLQVLAIPARAFWDGEFLARVAPGVIVRDDRPGAPADNWLWEGDQDQAGQVLAGYRSAWLPKALLGADQIQRFTDAIVATSSEWGLSLHLNKGLAGAPAAEIEAARDAATNPAVLDAFALLIMGGGQGPAYPGIPGHEPDVADARREFAAINKAAAHVISLVKDPGSYVSESDYFERAWKRSFWGANYDRLAAVKQRYDPDGLFYVHHGVGSDAWSADGFARRG